MEQLKGYSWWVHDEQQTFRISNPDDLVGHRRL